MMPFRILAVVVACAVGSTNAAEPLASPDYRRDVEPIFKKYCNGCHNAADREGKLNLESFDDILRGGAGGVVVVPARPELSRLLSLVEGREEPLMPPEGSERPTAEEIAVVSRWIAAGAVGPSGKNPDPTILHTPHVRLTKAARDPITSVATAPGKLGLAAIGSHGMVRLITLADQTVVRRLTSLRGPATDLEFSKNGKLLITAAGEPGVFGEAQLWNVADGKLIRTFTGHRDSLYAATLSPDARLLATGSYDQTIQLWDAATGKPLHTLAGHNGAVFDLAFHPSGKILASASADRTVKLWDVSTGVRLDTLGQPKKEQFAVAFSPDGRTLVAAGADQRIRLYSISPTAAENTNPLVLTRFAHEAPVLRLAFAPDGKTLYSSGEDRLVRVWNAQTLAEQPAFARQSDFAPGLAPTADGKQLLVGRMDGTFDLYNAETRQVVPPPAPEVVAVEPRGIQCGRTTRITLQGKHLLGATKVVLLDGAGKPVPAKVAIVAAERSPTSLALDLTPDANLPRGSYAIAVSGRGGQSAPVRLAVDDLPQQTELEPNDLAAQSALARLDAGYWGTCFTPGDVDHVRFAAKKGQHVVARLEAKAFGSMLDGFLTILDPQGEVVAANNDFDDDRDPLVTYRIPRDGVYTVRINDQSMNGSAQHFYRLTIGTFSLITGVFPTNITVGRATNVEFTGFNLPERAGSDVQAEAAGDVTVPFDAHRYRTTKPVVVRAVAETTVVEREPNDDPSHATLVATPAYADGRIFADGGTTRDVDYYRFESKRGQTWAIETEARRRGSPVDTKIEVLDAEGRPVPRLLLQSVRDSYITFRSINSLEDDVRLFNWQEMQLNEYLYISGDVARLFRMPQGPDSGFRLYGSAGKRRAYFDTNASSHALEETAYVVEPHPVGTKLVNNGLPVYTLYHTNDDDGLRRYGADSRLSFTAPADGVYLVKVADSRGFDGDRFHYRLTIRPARPDFVVRLDNRSPAVGLGSGTPLSISVDRQDGFEGEIEVRVDGLPPGYAISSPVRIEPGHDAAQCVLTAAPEAESVDAAEWEKVRFTARADVDGSPIEHAIAGLQSVRLRDKPAIRVTLEPAQLTIAPGTTITATLTIERGEGVDDRIGFDVLNLPHGVIVDNIGLNGILIPEKETKREIFLTCFAATPESERTFFAVSKTARGGAKSVGAEASTPVLLRVRRPATVVRAEDVASPPKAE